MGRWNFKNSKGIAGNAAGLFFPLREPLGFDARELTPTLVLKITRTEAETRSFRRATVVINDAADRCVISWSGARAHKIPCAVAKALCTIYYGSSAMNLLMRRNRLVF